MLKMSNKMLASEQIYCEYLLLMKMLITMEPLYILLVLHIIQQISSILKFNQNQAGLFLKNLST